MESEEEKSKHRIFKDVLKYTGKLRKFLNICDSEGTSLISKL